MNLEEFKKALSSDATEENKQLKKQLSELQEEYSKKLSNLKSENNSLKETCRFLCNRCFALTKGITCLFCVLDYPCPHMPNRDYNDHPSGLINKFKKFMAVETQEEKNEN